MIGIFVALCRGCGLKFYTDGELAHCMYCKPLPRDDR